MTLFKLAVGNIKKSMKDFAVYFVTLLFGICLFYVFNSIDTQSSMIILSESKREMIEMIQEIISYISVFIAFVLGFLIIYASRFMMKRRNKEFALYMLLGMGKRKVSLILFIENLIIGIISLVVGLVIGVGLSQITSVFVAYLFEADLTGYEFVFSQEACKKTCIYFAIIYLIVIIFNTVIISGCKLITLLQTSKRHEKIRSEHVILRIIGFFIGTTVIGSAYYIVIRKFEYITGTRLLWAIILGVIGTFIFFWSLSGILFTVCSKRKKLYHKGLNSFVVRQFSSQASSNVVSVSIICILFFVTICSLASALNIRNSMNKNLNKYCPTDYEYTFYANDTALDGLKEKLNELEKYNKETIYVNLLKEDFLIEDEADDRKVFIDTVLAESEYNRLAEYLGCDKVELSSNEYVIISNFTQAEEYLHRFLSNKPELEIANKKLLPKSDMPQDGFTELSYTADEIATVVISDEAAEGVATGGIIFSGKYNSDAAKNTEDTDEQIIKYIDKLHYYNYDYIFRTGAAENSVGTGALVTFIALYIGFIFLLSGAAILAIKELSESVDNKDRYQMLRKLGADEKMINRALFRQIGYFFVLPLLLAIIHSVAGMKFSTKLMAIFGNDEIVPAIGITAVVFAVIYGVYFAITYITSKRMIKER